MAVTPSMSWPRLLALAFAATIAVTTVSAYGTERWANRNEIADEQLAIMQRQPFVYLGQQSDNPQFRSRLLYPLAMTAMGRISPLSAADNFLVLRTLNAFAMFVLVGAVVLRRSGEEATRLLMAILTLVLVLSFNHGYERPTDYLDIMFMVAFILAARRMQYAAMLALTLIGVMNRESAIFAAIIWWFCAADDWRRRAAFAAVLGGTAVALAAGLRWHFMLDTGRITNDFLLTRMHTAFIAIFRDVPSPREWWIGLIAIGVLLGEWLRSVRGHVVIDRRLLQAAGVMTGITLFFGTVQELRVFMPIIAAILMAGIPEPS
jgi:hypothetical protein